MDAVAECGNRRIGSHYLGVWIGFLLLGVLVFLNYDPNHSYCRNGRVLLGNGAITSGDANKA